MSMQNGTKRRSPSIIARLMGLDGLLPQSPTHREPRYVENQQRRPITSEKAGGNGHRKGGSMRFKDVFEVLDAETEKSSISLHQRKVNANLTEAEMAFIRHKFMEAKCLSTDERSHLEFSEALDSNKDLLFKFLHHPDSLFTKHLPDNQSIECRELLRNSHRSSQWHGGGGANSSHSNTRCVPYDDTVHLSKKQQKKKKSGFKPTEIVVLKPNLGKPLSTDTTLPSQSSACDQVREKHRLLKPNEDVSLLRQKSSDSREIARIVSRQMKASCGNDSSINFENSRFRGFAGDETSFWSDSLSESKLVSVISRARTEFSRKNHCQSLPSRSPESSVSKETTRRLSERWKLPHKSEQEMEISRRNTLAEMLVTSDRDARLTSFSGISKRFESNVVEPELLDPIGISSRDGWRSTGKQNLSKPRTIMHPDRTRSYTIVLPKKLTMRDGSVKESSFHHREFSLSNSNNPHLSYNSSSEMNGPSSSKVLHLDGELSEEKLPILITQSSLSVHADSDTRNGSDYEGAKSTPSLEPLDLPAVTSLTDPDTSGRPTEELDHSSIPQVQPEESDEEGDQPSPVSILHTSFHDEFSSSSNCFESLSADLKGLRMKLQLLKSESTTYNEGAMLVSSDEDDDQEETSIVTDETLSTQEPREDWKSLYLADVLADSRFSDLNPESFMATWHSSESPVDPSLFKDLEKKYSGLKTSSRLERKFLFDRINSGILEFFEQFTDLKLTKVYPKWDRNLVQETLRELVTIKYLIPSRDTKEKELQRPNLEDDIKVIGKEIEELLTDELIAELVIGEFS